ncbi:glycosyltransferase [Actinophytocola oryzae]|uniref:Vancomycin aglycone glucosyltransferase n=1 Tax=Actinophytocola oryzae TaxID=502181 RepID=A0A4R7VXD8_9PSEU|nr:glycosyltransferase [Actinophytocola oryzae]TDV54796.1 vancomycin aglycone glucosyltransferase [Actinophytocola oryzae]
MRFLLSTIGSRGDFQPLLALGLLLREQGCDVRLCAPPDFRELAGGLPFVPIGPPLTARTPRPATQLELFASIAETVATQFATLREAGADRDVIVGCNQIQVAAPSVAELLGTRYVFADFSPVVLPSPHHAPVPLPGMPPADPSVDNRTLWQREAARRTAMWGPALNEQRVAAGLAPVEDVLGHVVTDHPVLAADPALAPWVTPADLAVTQTGAWLPADDRPLSAELTDFLAAGEPPVYFGFGSMASPRVTGAAMLEAARALGHRAIVLRGWAGLDAAGDDCLTVTETNLQALFPHVAAVVHHGGSGTTTTAALSGVPQVVVPHLYDQFYFADRVRELGIGVTHTATDSLTDSLKLALQPEVATRARSIAPSIRRVGAQTAADHLTHPPY